MSVLVVDGAQIHNQAALREEVEESKLIYLPPYSPDFDPVEHVFSKVKYYLRRQQHSLADHGFTAADMIQTAYDSVKQSDCQHWVSSCGYS